MSLIRCYNGAGSMDENEKGSLIEFLSDHLEEYGDPKEAIEKAIDYVYNTAQSPGGLILTCRIDQEIAGAAVINKTGMGQYIPENILVYIATHKNHRGKGIGRKLMEKAIEQTQGDIALHVEPENPAKKLYEKLGFTNKYLEMRLKK